MSGNQTQEQFETVTVVGTIDLHGKRKEDAISAVTRFLSDTMAKGRGAKKRPVWVRIITGSGNHGSKGPVLRNAVQATLSKRSMIYKLCSGNGAFIVRADSGHELYNAEKSPTFSKIVMNDTEQFKLQCLRQAKYCTAYSQQSSMPTKTVELRCLDGIDFVTPREVILDDLLVEKTKRISVKEVYKQKKNIEQEKKDVESVLRASMQEEMRIKEEEERVIGDALNLSMHEENTISEEEKWMEEAIALSRREADKEQGSINQEDDDSDFMRAMKESLEMEQKEEIIKRALATFVENEDLSEEEQMRLVLEESMKCETFKNESDLFGKERSYDTNLDVQWGD